ncbi:MULTISPECIES: alpha/beta hydrolase [unclassified Streptomyces]|uniref:alpha/beta hydrolase n=1 Tax=unclassified Streptomyces TaxID=2593676 RepID=UPI00036097C5|nr:MULTISPECIES: alpha/beta hydrolase [unclassified Streptomyces]MYT28175.1 alpha/beta fold hydrolase [Streptomyces sp. SID8354]
MTDAPYAPAPRPCPRSTVIHRAALYRGLLAVAILAALILTAMFTPATRTAARGARTDLRLGALQLTPCTQRPTGWCGTTALPLDRRDPDSPTLDIGFEWVPATGRPQGTVVVVDGGPGWATRHSRDAYLKMLGPLRASRNLLLFDLRGTGRSQALTCPDLEHYAGQPSGPDFAQTVGACGDQLDHTWHRPDGSWIHASELFGTVDATQDLADVLTQLGLSGVDLYGDSYGGWFAQVFAARHPSLLRSLTLDATYEVLGLDPWYTSGVTTARTAFALACRRAPQCAAHTSTDAWTLISRLASRLRTAPLTGTTTDLDGEPITVTVTVTTLVDLVNDAGVDPGIYRSLQAAAQTLLTRGDSAPLLRLAAQTTAHDGTNLPPPDYSSALYFAVACTDYPQLFAMTSPSAERARMLQDRIAAQPAATFAPFTTAEWTTVNAYTNTYDGCLAWPAPQRPHMPITTRPPLVPATVPALVLGGDLDSLTPAIGGRRVAAQLGPSARFITVPNLTHITAMPDATRPGPEACGQSLYRQFLRAPAAALHHLDTSCTRHTPAVPTLTDYPTHLTDTTPATPAPGNQAHPAALRAAAVGASALSDALARSGYLPHGHDTGLRGGTWTLTGTPQAHLTLTDVRWVTDATVNGTATWDQTNGTVTAHLTITPDTETNTDTNTGPGPGITIDITWNTLTPNTPASISGTAGDAPLHATLPSP